jgi:hypothetical protein
MATTDGNLPHGCANLWSGFPGGCSFSWPALLALIKVLVVIHPQPLLLHGM